MARHAYLQGPLVVTLADTSCSGSAEPMDSPPQRRNKATGALQYSPEGGRQARQARLDVEVDALKRAGQMSFRAAAQTIAVFVHCSAHRKVGAFYQWE